MEYALLIGLIALVCLAAVEFFGTSNQSSLNDSASRVASAGP